MSEDKLTKYSLFKEATMSINNLDDSIEAISYCVKLIMAKKGGNALVAGSTIAQGIITGLDSYSTEVVSMPQEVADKHSVNVGRVILKTVNSYIKTK